MTLPFAIPELTTERLVLRAPRESDLPAMIAFAAGPRSRYVGGPQTAWETWRGFAAGIGHWALKGYGFFSVDLRETGDFIGRVGVICPHGWPEPELGWHLYDGHEGNGYAAEAARAARDHAHAALGLGPLISHIHPENARSIRLAERLGARLEREGELLGEPCLVYRHPAPETAA